jgi:DNA-binding transcriptional LysR family regulator
VDNPDELSGTLGMVANEDMVALLPAFMRDRTVPGIVIIPVADAKATWNLFVAWQRGQISEPLRTLLSALPFPTRDS